LEWCFAVLVSFPFGNDERRVGVDLDEIVRPAGCDGFRIGVREFE